MQTMHPTDDIYAQTQLRHPERLLTIAGSDSGGGAGIQADLKTFAALGGYGMSVITAVTAQNTQGVTAIQPIDAAIVKAQLQAVLSDIGAQGIKTGMLFSEEIIKVVAEELAAYRTSHPSVPIVVDPVAVATSGSVLLQTDAVAAYRALLAPLATLITPNLHEAALLTGLPVPEDVDGMRACAQALINQHGYAAVLIKGGHLKGGDSATDLLLHRTQETLITLPWIDTRNTHGTGCTLSSAIAAKLAEGLDLTTAVKEAKHYLWRAVQAGRHLHIGHGAGPLWHNV